MAQRKKEPVASGSRDESTSRTIGNESNAEKSLASPAPATVRAGEGRAPRRATTPAESTPDGAASKSASARNRSGIPNLQKQLRDFASARPEGWGHDDWLNFLRTLEESGHNITDREAIGLALEKERVDLALSQVKGVGPQRRQALIERFGNLWSLRHADASEIASVAGMPRSLADEVKSRIGDR